MPPSQLKRLKTSLRERGITGPQKSKKQKRQPAAKPSGTDRIQRNVALQEIRDAFNPFEIRQPSRASKFESVSREGANRSYKAVLYRPGVSKSAGEDARRATLLPELRRRNKVGELIDRRLGEGDEGLSAEQKALQRLAKAKSRNDGRLFDLEVSDDDIGEIGSQNVLTHGGRSIADIDRDDFKDEGSISLEDDSDPGILRRKRRRSDVDEEADDLNREVDAENSDDTSQRKKSKKEVMEEVIAKSKLHKYERQKAKEDDDDLRANLDAGMQDMLALLQGHKPPKAQPRDDQAKDSATNNNGAHVNPERQKLLDGADRAGVDKEYDARLRQLAQDVRAVPSERTKTVEERAVEEAKKLQELENRRLKRMRGEPTSDDEAGADTDEHLIRAGAVVDEDDDMQDDAMGFGLKSMTTRQIEPRNEDNVVLDDEDEFDIDDDLVASGSESDSDSSQAGYETSESTEQAVEAEPNHDDEEDEFVRGILGKPTIGTEDALLPSNQSRGEAVPGKLAFTFPCPRSHKDFLDVLNGVSFDQIPTVVQRIRALHHPSLSASNNEAMSDFSAVLVDHVAWMGVQKQPLPVIEQLIRHLHSLSRTYATRIAVQFRKHLSAWQEAGTPVAGCLTILTAIGSIYPTSDHFHQVVTPAITLMARYLSLTIPSRERPETLVLGAFMVASCLKYQTLSRRYVPEAVRFTFKTLSIDPTPAQTLLQPHLANLVSLTELWKEKSAFTEVFSPFVRELEKLKARKELQHLQILLSQAKLRRRPLELHHHRKLAIRTNVPKFEESFNPDKHYDPDKERSDARKLQKEYKRERKGALRELRKDASFIAREQLREKKERDVEYERKYRRLVAEVQAEEGHAAKEYAREKEGRRRR